MGKIAQIPGFTSCPSCNSVLQIDGTAIAFFLKSPANAFPCSSCKVNLNLFDVISKEVEKNFFFTTAYHIAGATSSVFTVTMNRGKLLSIDLKEYDVPATATVLEINYTPNGLLFPLEVHGNSPTRHSIRHKFELYPVSFQENPIEQAPLNMMVTWINVGDDDVALNHLIRAFRYYSSSNFLDAPADSQLNLPFAYENTVIPANVAIEMSLVPVVRKALARLGLASHADDKITYSHYLNLLLPLCCGRASAPLLPDAVRTQLNVLRKKRNEIGHSGKFDAAVSKNEMAKMLTGSLFGFHYCKLVLPSFELFS